MLNFLRENHRHLVSAWKKQGRQRKWLGALVGEVRNSLCGPDTQSARRIRWILVKEFFRQRRKLTTCETCKTGSATRVTLCGHQYCKGCIRTWPADATCPVCQNHLRRLATELQLKTGTVKLNKLDILVATHQRKHRIHRSHLCKLIYTYYPHLDPPVSDLWP